MHFPILHIKTLVRVVCPLGSAFCTFVQLRRFQPSVLPAVSVEYFLVYSTTSSCRALKLKTKRKSQKINPACLIFRTIAEALAGEPFYSLFVLEKQPQRILCKAYYVV